MKLSIAKQFSRTPGPRYEKEGKFSGELFRKSLLLPIFLESKSQNEKLEINLDGTAGYGTSFLEEAFGGLARELGIQVVLDNIIIVSKEIPYLKEDVEEYIQDANQHQSEITTL